MTMRILKFQAENVKKLSVVEINPDGSLVMITGKNGAGKSTILDCIAGAIEGAKHVGAEPLRKGQKKGKIRLELGGEQVELTVERRFTESGSTLIVETADGVRPQKPQSIMDALYGAISFDPLTFARSDRKTQLDMLRKLVKMDVNPDVLDGANQRDFEKRTEVNREAKSLAAQAEGIIVPPDLPDAPIDTDAIMEELTEVDNFNADVRAREEARRQHWNGIQSHRLDAEKKRKEAEELRRRGLELDADAGWLEDKVKEEEGKVADLPALPALKSAVEIRARLEDAQSLNKGIEAKKRRDDLLAKAKAKDAESLALTEAIDARNKAKADAIAGAKMPIDGLSFADGGVTFNGVLFDQASSAEQLRVSMAIAMAANPELRVMLIREGVYLDDDGLRLVAEMAKESGYQVWIETLRPDGHAAVIMEDGMVKAVTSEQAAEPVAALPAESSADQASLL